jgi:aryl-alcohol dehydrogenase-like predicted oxidoreductase
MEYRKLGHSGLIVSAVSLGTMQFGKAMNLGSLDQKETTAMIKAALDLGVSFIDTADVYSRGESEMLVGNALKGIRQNVVLATKVRLPMSDTDFNHSGATRVNIRREIEDSLRRLQTDYVDLYQVHGWDKVTPIEETLRTLDDLVREGKVRYIGLSNYFAWQAAVALGIQHEEHLERFVTAQLYYSLVGRGLENGWMQFAEYSDLGILVWSPLAGGYLSGKYKTGQRAASGTRFADAGQFVPFDEAQGERTLDELRKVAERHQVSPARAAIAWTLGRPCVSSVIVAARTIAHLEDNIAAVDLKLTLEDIAELDRVSDPGTPYPKWMVLQLNEGEDPRPKALDPKKYADGGSWQDLRGRKKW